MMAKGKDVTVALAIDPGLSTGYVVARTTPHFFKPTHSGVIWWEGRIKVLNQLLITHKPQHIIIERFALYGQMAKKMINSEFEAVQVIGNVQALAFIHDYNVETDISVLPAAVKGAISVLKEHRSLLAKPKSNHVDDAYKLLRYWWIYNIRER